MNNPPVWLLACPAAIFSVVAALREKERDQLFLAVLFAAMYLQFALIDRPMFIYSALVVLPFVYLFVANGVVSLIRRARAANWIYGGTLVATTAWGLYLYPLVTELTVPSVLYMPLFSLGMVFF